MPRVFFDRTGFKIAKPGYNARTAAEVNLLFSSAASSLSLYMTGIVGLSPVAHDAAEVYRAGTVSFGKTFSNPPLVYFAGIVSGSKIDCSILTPAGTLATGHQWRPMLWGTTTTTSCTIYCMRYAGKGTSGADNIYYGSDCTTARYYIMENTIQ